VPPLGVVGSVLKWQLCESTLCPVVPLHVEPAHEFAPV
jgi:hypothetical protein